MTARITVSDPSPGVDGHVDIGSPGFLVKPEARSSGAKPPAARSLDLGPPAARAAQEVESGLKKDGTPSKRTAKGKTLAPLKRTDRARKDQFGNGRVNGGVTNACHIVDWDLAKSLFPYVTPEEQAAFEEFLNGAPNLPIKSRAENMEEDRPQDVAIIRAIEDGVPVTDEATRERAGLKLALVAGAALNAGVPEDKVRHMVEALASVGGAAEAADRYPVVFRDGKPVNLWPELPAAETGLTKDGSPHMGTKAGRARAERAGGRAASTGLKKDGASVDGRTSKGQKVGVPKAEEAEAVTGLKEDGAPSKRTVRGKALVAEAKGREVRTGLKKDGTPSMRTAKGKALAKALEAEAKAKAKPAPPAPKTAVQQAKAAPLPPAPARVKAPAPRPAPAPAPAPVRAYCPPPRVYAPSPVRAPAYSAAPVVGTYSSSGSANGRTMYVGPRGGTYYMSSGGNRVYR